MAGSPSNMIVVGLSDGRRVVFGPINIDMFNRWSENKKKDFIRFVVLQDLYPWEHMLLTLN